METSEITDMIAQLWEMQDRIDPQTFKDTMDSLQGELGDKVDTLCWLLDQLDEEKAVLKVQLERRGRITRTIKSIENRQKSIKDYLRFLTDEQGGRMLTDEHVLKTVKAGGQQVKIEDEAAVPDTFTVTTTKLDKGAIKDALKDGQAVPGAELYQPYRVSIK